METNDGKDRRDDIFSRSVRAGKRTYFFDVKATRINDYYLTITESTKRFNDDGTFFYEKHRVFLYKEDFEKFSKHLSEVTRYIINAKGAAPILAERDNHHGNGRPKSETETTADDSVDGNKTDILVQDELIIPKSSEESNLVEDAHERAAAGMDESEDDGPVAVTVNADGESGEDESGLSQENIDPEEEPEK